MVESAIYRWSHPKKILVATGLLESPSIMAHAAEQAKLAHAQILLVHVIRQALFSFDVNSHMPFVVHGPALQKAHALLNQITRTFEQEGILCEPIVLNGEPAEQISLLANARDVDRVIVASSGHRGIARLLFGSLSRDLAASLEVPVCIVGHRALSQKVAQKHQSRILVATSLRASSELCAGVGAELAMATGSSITLLHVIEQDQMNVGERERASRDAFHELESMLTDEHTAQLHPNFQVRVGSPATEILAVARAVEPSLIVLGSPVDSLIHSMCGSKLVDEIVVEATCPILSVRQLKPSFSWISEDLVRIPQNLAPSEQSGPSSS